MDQKLDYAPLIAQAMKRHKMTRYAVAKALGFKSISVIYRIEKGGAGMSAPKLTRLLQLAGKLAIGVAIGIGIAPMDTASAAQGAVRPLVTSTTHYAHIRIKAADPSTAHGAAVTAPRPPSPGPR